MAINWGAGFAAAGSRFADVVEKATLEQQKSDLERERLVIANQLAAERENTKMAHESSENALTRAQTVSENEKTRNTTERGQNLTLQGHQEMAGATRESTASHERIAGQQLELQKQTAVAFDADKNGNVMLFNKITGKATPVVDDKGVPVTKLDNDLLKTGNIMLGTLRTELDTVTKTHLKEMAGIDAQLTAYERNATASIMPETKAKIEALLAQKVALQNSYGEQRTAITTNMQQITKQIGGGKFDNTTPLPPLAPGVRPPLDEALRQGAPAPKTGGGFFSNPLPQAATGEQMAPPLLDPNATGAAP